jgi:hypothetical protein
MIDRSCTTWPHLATSHTSARRQGGSHLGPPFLGAVGQRATTDHQPRSKPHGTCSCTLSRLHRRSSALAILLNRPRLSPAMHAPAPAPAPQLFLAPRPRPLSPAARLPCALASASQIPPASPLCSHGPFSPPRCPPRRCPPALALWLPYLKSSLVPHSAKPFSQHSCPTMTQPTHPSFSVHPLQLWPPTPTRPRFPHPRPRQPCYFCCCTDHPRLASLLCKRPTTQAKRVRNRVPQSPQLCHSKHSPLQLPAHSGQSISC